MEKTVPELMAAISPSDWALVPQSVLELIYELVRRTDKLEQEMAQLRTENELLKEQVARTSAFRVTATIKESAGLSRIGRSPPEKNGVGN